MNWELARTGPILLALIAGAGLLFWTRMGQRRRHGLWTRAPYPFGRWQAVHALWFFMGAAALALAYLRPSWGYEERPRVGRGQDVMVVLDISHSMLAQDVAPNRLQRARREILDLVAASAGARVGLVVAGEAAYLQCPLTRDGEALKVFMDGVREEEAENRGSDLGAGIRLAVETLTRARDEDHPGQSILILSDGEDHGDGAKAGAQAAKDAGIRVDALGIGSPDGAPLPAAGGGWKKDGDGRIVVSRLDGALLEAVSAAGGGRYVLATPDDRDLAALGLFSKDVGTKTEEGTERVPRERYPVFVWAAFGLLFTEAWRRRRAG